MLTKKQEKVLLALLDMPEYSEADLVARLSPMTAEEVRAVLCELFHLEYILGLSHTADGVTKGVALDNNGKYYREHQKQAKAEKRRSFWQGFLAGCLSTAAMYPLIEYVFPAILQSFNK